MKKMYLFAAFLAIAITSGSVANAQLSIHVNIGHNRPAMVPAPVLVEQQSDCYYYPEANVYFDPRQSQYRYYDQGRWVNARELPPMYRGRDFSHMRRVAVDREWAYRQMDQRRDQDWRGSRNDMDRGGMRDRNDRDYNRNGNMQRDDHRNDINRYRG